MKDSINIDSLLEKIHENHKKENSINEDSAKNQKHKMRKFIFLGEIAEEIFGSNVDEEFLIGCFIAAKMVYDERGERYKKTKERGREFLKNRRDEQT